MEGTAAGVHPVRVTAAVTVDLSVEAGAFPFLPARRDPESAGSPDGFSQDSSGISGLQSPCSDSGFSSDDTRLLDPSRKKRPFDMLSSCLPQVRARMFAHSSVDARMHAVRRGPAGNAEQSLPGL